VKRGRRERVPHLKTIAGCQFAWTGFLVIIHARSFDTVCADNREHENIVCLVATSHAVHSLHGNLSNLPWKVNMQASVRYSLKWHIVTEEPCMTSQQHVPFKTGQDRSEWD